ncbi:MAG: hypothetical protein M1833_000286 [Piccolia ochrophora]|nr:MAG: hypothetical protein M1833_000286 [Piccolia ochrophora]
MRSTTLIPLALSFCLPAALAQIPVSPGYTLGRVWLSDGLNHNKLTGEEATPGSKFHYAGFKFIDDADVGASLVLPGKSFLCTTSWISSEGTAPAVYKDIRFNCAPPDGRTWTTAFEFSVGDNVNAAEGCAVRVVHALAAANGTNWEKQGVVDFPSPRANNVGDWGCFPDDGGTTCLTVKQNITTDAVLVPANPADQTFDPLPTGL